MGSNSTNTRIIFKNIESTTDGTKYYFVVHGMSFTTFGYISKVYVTEQEYYSYEIQEGPRFVVESLKYPYMDLGKIVC